MRPKCERRLNRRGLIYAGGSVAPIVPSDIPGLLFWLKDSYTTTPTKISSWNDISGNNNHFIQAVDAQRPVFTAADANFNNKPSAQFNAAQALKSTSALGSWDNLTLCYVTRPIGVIGNALLGVSDNSGSPRGWQTYQSGGLDGPNMYNLGAAGTDRVRFSSPDITLTKYHRVFRMPFSTLSTASPDIYTAGAASTLEVVSNTATNTTTVAGSFMTLGAINTGGSAGYNGKFASVICYGGNGTTGLLTPAQIAGLYAWTSLEYGA